MLSIIIELCTKTHINLKAYFILLCKYRTTFDNSLSGKKKMIYYLAAGAGCGYRREIIILLHRGAGLLFTLDIVAL